MSVCPGAYSMEWKGRDGRVLSPFLFLSLFPVYFAGADEPLCPLRVQSKSLMLFCLLH